MADEAAPLPISLQPSLAATAPRTTPIAIWSLVLSLLFFVGGWLLTIDNHPSLQDELSGTENGSKVVFLDTTLDDGDNFHQILAWTLKSRWQQQNEILREATNSFHREK
jgi:hypothetical protein